MGGFFTEEITADLTNFLNTLNSVSDHSCAILAGSKIDAQLEKAIEVRLMPAINPKDDQIFSGNGALATFSSKIEIAYRIGIIAPQHASSLNQLRKIRNHFAHGMDNLVFNDSPARDHIQNFSKPWRGETFEEYLNKIKAETISLERAEFITTCSFYIGLFTPLHAVLEPIKQIKYVADLDIQLQQKEKEQ